MNILVFAPHPDDDIIGCGGSIAKHVRAGNTVSVIYMTSGEAGNFGLSRNGYGLVREKEAGQAANLLGIKNLIFIRKPDGYLTFDKVTIIKLVNIIREIKPELIYIPHANDAHSDHIVTHQIVMQAVWRAAEVWFEDSSLEPWRVANILCYEVWVPLQEINYIEDISGVINIKINALKLHASQVSNVPYHEAIEGLNRYRGIMTGLGSYVECFQILKANIFKPL